jgi:hypothetical protein
MARKDPEARRAYNKAYNEANKERLRQHRQARRKDLTTQDIEDKASYNKQYYRANKERIRSQIESWREQQKLNDPTSLKLYKRCRSARANAKRKKLPYDLSLTYLRTLYESQAGNCALTGAPLFMGQGDHPLGASLDRIDNTKGYVLGNVRLVAYWANIGRGEWSDDEFYFHCRTATAYADTRK